MEKRSTGKRLLKKTDYALLKQKLCDNSGPVCLSEDDLAVLWSGEAAFLWESPLAATAEEAEALVRRAAFELAPAPGRAVLGAVMLLIVDSETGLGTVEAAAGAIQRTLPKDAATIFGLSLDPGQKGIRLLLAVCEGSADERGNAQ